ncbi:MAG: class I SAM-dependent methyltransferase [Acidimicrobiia bacterium]
MDGERDWVDRTRSYWNTDARTYDRSRSHAPDSNVARVAWATAISELLPDPPATVLDVGAGTGFLSLAAARLGHRVTALDLAPAMLEMLHRQAEESGLSVELVEGDAHDVPARGFEAVISRHVLWTLPDPVRALASWRKAAPGGRLVLIDSMWGRADPLQRVREVAGSVLDRVVRGSDGHHAPYPEELQESLPFGHGITPDELIELVEGAGWCNLRIRRLRDVEWAMAMELPRTEAPLGVRPIYALSASGRS